MTACARALLTLVLATFVGCQPPSPAPRAPGTIMAPDIHPPDSKVSLVVGFGSREPIPLGPRSSQLLLQMLAGPSVHTDISTMDARPMGTFIVGEVAYLWHGNGVTRGTGNEERLWRGPFTQRLISDIMATQSFTRESAVTLLSVIESDPTVATTPVEGPGAYPGGGDALHPLP